MARLIDQPKLIQTGSDEPKRIEKYIGRVNAEEKDRHAAGEETESAS